MCGCTHENAEFPIIVNAAGAHEQVQVACCKCWKAFTKAWSCQWDWPGLCAECEVNAETKETFKASVEIESGDKIPDEPGESAAKKIKAGFTIMHNYAVIESDNFSDTVEVPNLSPKLANIDE